MHRLTDAVLDEIGDEGDGDVLQVACVYGAFSNRLAQRVGNLHVADIAPIQLENSRRKLVGRDNVQLHHMDSASLEFGDGRFSDTVVFFLLHEQPEAVRRRTIAEAVRVTRPGGRVVIVDYHRPSVWNPLRYVMHPVLKWLEPFALDLWRNPIERYFPDGFEALESVTTRYFGGMYQKVVVRLP
jgi:ubiquinone/menaquinone biosynthesis C-methylase UbiE